MQRCNPYGGRYGTAQTAYSHQPVHLSEVRAAMARNHSRKGERGGGMSVRTVFAHGIETEMLDCDRCENASDSHSTRP